MQQSTHERVGHVVSADAEAVDEAEYPPDDGYPQVLVQLSRHDFEMLRCIGYVFVRDAIGMAP